MPTRLRGISTILAEAILLAATIAIVAATVSWIMGLFGNAAQPEIYQHYIIVLNGPDDTAHIGLPGLALIDAWSRYNTTIGAYRVYLRVTAVKKLSYIKVEARIRCCGGQAPPGVLNPYVVWEDYSVPPGWYSEQYWTPITPDEYPIYIYLHIWIREQG